MRLPVIVTAACVLLAAVVSRADARPPTSLDITARTVDFSYDRMAVRADGGVRVRLSDGTIVSGDTFTMDLKQNRYLVAGGVRLDGGGVHETGAGFAGFLDFDRSYFLPARPVPDRWTYFGDDWRHPHPGRQQPGDAFAFNDFPGRPYIKARHATIIPHTSVIFTNVLINAASVYVPVPRYVVTFAPNPNFVQNSLAGARWGVGIPYNGSAHALTELDVRNDQIRGTYLALQQHFAWDRDWISASLNPIDQEQKQYNFIGFKQVSPAIQARAFYQLSEQQQGLVARPLDAGSFANFSATFALRHSSLVVNADQYNWYILGIKPTDVDARHHEHPQDASLSWAGWRFPISHTGFQYQLRSGIALAHDQFGVIGFPGQAGLFPDAWYHWLGVSVIGPTYYLDGKHRYSATLSGDKQRTWFNIAHHVDQTSAGASVARSFLRNNKLSTYLAYGFGETADYWGNNQSLVYPGGTTPVVGPYGTYTNPNFRGLASSHAYTWGTSLAVSPNISASMTVRRSYDYPAPVPGVYGQPPWQLGTGLQVRLARYIQVQLSRGYYFNYANNRWTQPWGFYIGP